MFALGAAGSRGNKEDHYVDLGARITHTCHESYKRTGSNVTTLLSCDFLSFCHLTSVHFLTIFCSNWYWARDVLFPRST
jgi:hypothetical protein